MHDAASVSAYLHENEQTLAEKMWVKKLWENQVECRLPVSPFSKDDFKKVNTDACARIFNDS